MRPSTAMAATAASLAPRFFPHVEGLRGLAALYVFLFHMRHVVSADGVFAALVHATPFLAFGHYAVAVFIVISGYCLAAPLAARPERPFDVRAFAMRRIRRIYPAYLGALVVSALLFYPWHEPSTGQALPASGLAFGLGAHVLLIHNLFHTTSEALNGPMWSVGLESQIYVVFALVLVPIWLRYGVGAQLAVAVALGLVPHFVFHGALDWTCPWFLGLFALGVCAAKLTRQPGRAPWRLLAIVCSVAAAVAVPVLHVQGDAAGYGPFLAMDYLVGCAAGVFLIAAVDQRGALWGAARILALPPLVWLGTISYSLYLLHIIVVLVAHAAIVHYNVSSISAALWYLAIIPCGIALAALSYRYLERPFLSRPASVLAQAPKGQRVVASLQSSAPSIAVEERTACGAGRSRR